MVELKGSKTEQNLMTAFAGESQAHTKYEYYASQAKKDGYVQISNIFSETSHNEKEHAKIWFKLLHGGSIQDTASNLKDAAEGEIAYLFDAVGAIEKEHNERYDVLLKKVEEGSVFVKEEEIIWICGNCGHIFKGKEAPEKCPVCAHPKAYFEKKGR